MHLAYRLQVKTKRRVTQKLAAPGIAVIQTRFPLQLENWNELQHVRQRQLPVRNRISQDKTIFKRLCSAIRSRAYQDRVPANSLKRDVFADLYIVEDFLEPVPRFCSRRNGRVTFPLEGRAKGCIN